MPDRCPPLVLVGAGLASALIAQRLSVLDDGPSIVILEASDRPFGDHTWSFHDADVEASDLVWLQPMIAHHWQGQSVRFRGHSRALPSGYGSLTAGSVAAVIARLNGVQLKPNAKVTALAADQVTLADGTVQQASCVIDCRGFRHSDALVLGYQKFVGLEVELRAPHQLAHPVIMDATVDQQDGYRFVYLLPFSPTRVLIEDTRYSDGPGLDEPALAAEVTAYARHQGWSIERVIRQEQGVLPIALAQDFDRFWSELPDDIPQAGMRAALFHPTTGYSLPDAVRTANLVAREWPSSSENLARVIRAYAARQHRRQRFYRMLNRMLFRAARPERRHRVLERFYTLPTPLIERFYAGRTSHADMLRILAGKPPVPIHRALACLLEAPLMKDAAR